MRLLFFQLIESYRGILDSANAMASAGRGEAITESFERMIHAAVYGQTVLDTAVQRTATDTVRPAAGGEEGEESPGRTRQVSISVRASFLSLATASFLNYRPS